MLGDRLRVQLGPLPFDQDPGSLDHANGGFGDLRPDAIAWNQHDSMAAMKGLRGLNCRGGCCDSRKASF